MERSPSGTTGHPATSRSPAPTAQELSSTSHFIHIIVLLARSLARAKMVRRSAIYNTAIQAPFLLEAQPTELVLLQPLHRDRLARRSNGFGLSTLPSLRHRRI